MDKLNTKASLKEALEYIRSLEESIDKLKNDNQNLIELLAKLNHSMYGRSSEKDKYIDDGQLSLFNEAEKEYDSGAEEPTTVTVEKHERKKKITKDELVENLPHYEVDCTLEDTTCKVCNEEMIVIGREKVRSELVIIPEKMAVIDYYRYSYKCVKCEKETGETNIVKAPTPVPVMKKSMAAPATVAYVMQEKYVNGVPLYRQEQYWKSKGVALNRNTLANWIIRSSMWFNPVYEHLKKALLKEEVIHADETELLVLKEDGRTASQKSRMWVYCSGKYATNKIVLHEYAPTRSGEVARRTLKGFAGYLQTDGYSAYNKVENVKHVGCWSHARRKWVECLPKGIKVEGSKASEALELIQQLFALEENFKELKPKERNNQRVKQSKPVLEAYWELVENINANQGSSLKKAQTYSLNQRKYLEEFLSDASVVLSNNRVENAIRPFVIGRKNFLFSDTSRGADASALCYSIIETAKINKLNPYGYLLYLLTELPKLGEKPSCEQLEAVMPWSNSLPDYCKFGNDIQSENVIRTK